MYIHTQQARNYDQWEIRHDLSLTITNHLEIVAKVILIYLTTTGRLESNPYIINQNYVTSGSRWLCNFVRRVSEAHCLIGKYHVSSAWIIRNSSRTDVCLHALVSRHINDQEALDYIEVRRDVFLYSFFYSIFLFFIFFLRITLKIFCIINVFCLSIKALTSLEVLFKCTFIDFYSSLQY